MSFKHHSALDDVIKDSRLEAVLQDILYNVRDAEGKAVENIKAEQLALKWAVVI